MEMGTGHLMRCLSLADALQDSGARSCFVSRNLPTYLREMVIGHGHDLIPLSTATTNSKSDGLTHFRWLGASQATDAQETATALLGQTWDWLVVDHYAIDARWEGSLRGVANRLLVIDDLADRSHDADVLVDQNLYSNADSRYAGRVSAGCLLLLGPKYALLRKEFIEMRRRIRPRSGPVNRILVFFGGVDAGNLTGMALEVLADAPDLRGKVDVVIGSQHPNRCELESACADLGFSLHVQTQRMAELMAAADLSVGASGSANWERCCLGLPAIVVVAADHQRAIADGLTAAGAVWSLGETGDGTADALKKAVADLRKEKRRLAKMSEKAFAVMSNHQSVAAVMSAA